MKTSTLLLLAAAAGGGYYLYTRRSPAVAPAPAVPAPTPISTPAGTATSFLDRIMGGIVPGAMQVIKEQGRGVLSPPIYVPQKPNVLAGNSLAGDVFGGGPLGSLS